MSTKDLFKSLKDNEGRQKHLTKDFFPVHGFTRSKDTDNIVQIKNLARFSLPSSSIRKLSNALAAMFLFDDNLINEPRARELYL